MWKQEETAGGVELRTVGGGQAQLPKGGPILPDEVAFVGKDVEFKGSLLFGTVRIDGALDVKFTPTTLVRPEAILKAKISAGTVVCQGTITVIFTRRTRCARAPAVVEGSLITPVLSMEEGVVFNGTLEMKPQAKAERVRDVETNVVSIASRPPVQRLAA